MAHWGIAHEPVGQSVRRHQRRRRSIERGKAIDGQGARRPDRRRRASARSSTPSPSSSADADAGHAARSHHSYEAAMKVVRRQSERQRSEDLLRAGGRADRRRRPTRPTRSRLQAAAILEPLFKQMPEHPGLAHYIIHAYDAPPLADKALAAARRYASLAPAIPHALHMPSHTFTRVGSWKESIETNKRSAEAARKRPAAPAKSCTRSTTRPTRICRLAQDKAAKARASIARLSGRRRRRRRRRPAPPAPARLPLPRFRRAMRSSAAPGPRPRR